MRTKKKDGKRKPTVKKTARRKTVGYGSNLQRAVQRGLDRVAGTQAELVPYAPTSHEQLKQVMARLTPTNEQTDNRRITSIDQVSRIVTYDEPQASARGAYTRPARW